MNLDQFFEELAKTKGQWKINEVGQLRSTAHADVDRRRDLCPLHVVAGINTFHTQKAVEKLGLTFSPSVIYDAVDNIQRHSNIAMRDRLLAAVGLNIDGTPVVEPKPSRKVPAKVTLSEFFDILKASPRRWVITDIGGIEYVPFRGTQRYDPMTYVFLKTHKKVKQFADYAKVMTALGLAEYTVEMMRAVDGWNDRAALVQALRLRTVDACQPVPEAVAA